jgi:hypothetical protein
MPEDPTTPAEAEAPTAKAEAQDAAAEPETFDRDYVEKLRKEAASYRTKLREREEAELKAAEEKRQAELTAEQRAQEAEAKAQKALEAAEARVQAAERRAALAGKVSNPERVMRLMDDPEPYFPDGQPDMDAIRRDFPEYAPDKPHSTPVTPANAPGVRDGIKSAADLKGKTPEEINAWVEQNVNLDP